MDNKIRVIVPRDAAGQILSMWLDGHGYYVSEPCGGQGKCRKCAVDVISGNFTDRHGNDIVRDGKVLSCQAVCPDAECVVEIPVFEDAHDVSADTVAKNASKKHGRTGYALDIGTTTLALAKVDIDNRVILNTVSQINPQRMYGADVITRISACEKGELDALRSCLLTAVSAMLASLADGESTSDSIMTVAGNTTMLHIFCGVSPVGIGRFPFTPEFTDMKVLNRDESGLDISKVYVLPSASAYIGADIVCGILSSGMLESGAPVMLIDIGTNGEMALFTGKDGTNELITASTAAGPALEGANISCGMGGVSGAVSKVSTDGSAYSFSTIGDVSPLGICGAGLIDLFACMLENEAVDEAGCLDDDEFMLTGNHVKKNGAESLDSTPVVITQKDVREFQLANSAIRAGAEALLDEGGIAPEDVSVLNIAGGLGFYLDKNSAVRTGMINPVLNDVVSAIGNSSLSGAVLALYGEENRNKLTAISKQCRNIELNESDVFNDGFVEYMIFPEAE